MRRSAPRRTFTTVLNLLRPTKLYVPAMLKAPDQPTPCFLKNNKGEQFLWHILPRSRCRRSRRARHFFMPFPACNNIVVKPELELTGLVINPFSDNLVLKTELVRKLQ